MSWGGTVVQELYRHRPELVATLILVDTYAGWKGSLPDEEVRVRVADARQRFAAPAEDFDPERVGELRALAYDVVWNGQELGGGSIRISDPGLQQRALETIGIESAEASERFGFLLDALRYGAPPHGGIAYGLDRWVQRLLHADNIRDVIAFPKAASGADPLTGAPAPVDEAQLRELGISVRAPRPS